MQKNPTVKLQQNNISRIVLNWEYLPAKIIKILPLWSVNILQRSHASLLWLICVSIILPESVVKNEFQLIPYLIDMIYKLCGRMKFHQEKQFLSIPEKYVSILKFFLDNDSHVNPQTVVIIVFSTVLFWTLFSALFPIVRVFGKKMNNDSFFSWHWNRLQ